MKVAPLIVCLLCILCFSCNEVDSKGEEDILAFVQKWNKNHTRLKAPFLQRDYMDVVEYYGKERTKAELRQDKLVLFEQFPDYTQQLLNEQLTITKENGLYLVVFTNQVLYNGVEAPYEYYLSLILKNGTYKIVREGVAQNDKNRDAAIFPKFREATIAISRNRQLFGDFNGDGLSDYAYVTSPELLSESEKNKQGDATSTICRGECTSILNFSAPDLNAITIENAYQSQLENLKDLNGDSADEIGFWSIKPSQKSLYIFDATNSRLLTPPVTINTAVHKNLDLIDVVKKTGPGKITVTRSVQRNSKWVLESEIVVLD